MGEHSFDQWSLSDSSSSKKPNKKLAEEWFEGIKKRFKRDRKIFQLSIEFMKSYLVVAMQKNGKMKTKRVDVGTCHIMVCTTHKNLAK